MKKTVLYAALVTALSFAVYIPTLSGGFYYDDNVVFLGHQAKHLAETPFAVFGSEVHALPGTPRSLHVFFLLLLYKAFGPNPIFYHLFNLLFHAGAALLVFVFVKKLTKNDEVSLLSGLIFGLHPVHVENISFVTLGGTDLFYAFWAMLSLYLYLLFRDGGKGSKGLVYLALSVVFYGFALLSKESAVSFILAYPLVELFLRKRGFLWAFPHLGVLAAMKRGFLAGGAKTLAAGGGAEGRGIGDAVLSLGYFIKSLIAPYPLSPVIKDFPNPSLLYVLAAVFLAALAALAWRRMRLAVFGGGLFLAASFPYLFVPFIESNVAVTADRYMYAPSIGFAILLAAMISGIGKRSIKIPLSAGLLASYAVLGVLYCYSAWKNEEAFWKYAAKMNPEQVSSYVSLAGIELEKGNVKDGRMLLLEGLRKPKGMPAEYAQAAHMLGGIEMSEGRVREAESYWLLAVNYSPYEFAFMDLGVLYLRAGNPDRARWAFENALMFPQQSPRAMLGLAKSLELLGDKERARDYAMRVYAGTRDEALRAAAAEMLR